jgi:hypothetical protein
MIWSGALMKKKKNEMNPEKIAYWFFRLNGCATITNFVVHPDRRGSQRTDVDVLAVRFPYWHEILTFIFDRLTRYQAQKAHHGQWDITGKQLYDLASRHTQKEFVDTVRVRMQTHVAAQQPARQNPGVENHD